MIKRGLDLLLAGIGLVLLWPVMLVVAGLVKLSSPGPVFYTQERIGRRFRPFDIYKFRTMRVWQDAGEPGITVGDDARITAIGAVLRRSRLDEVPQLWNVLKGDMSLVGPRPELGRYVALFPAEYAEILEARPGLTDLASIRYHNEAVLLADAADPESEYVNRILPDKIRLARDYVRRSSPAFDLSLLVKTVFRLAGIRNSE